ncbi:DUF3331 domain-containing protein [Paraburkholderia tropica]|uniref:DUF3331 domain-containing protein n=1 Tax=Paraburkholderia tropica TaxID=92647 RepID=UPI003D2D60FF
MSLNDANTHLVWESTVALLGRISSPDDELARAILSGQHQRWEAWKKSAAARHGVRNPHTSSFTIVDRVSDRSILICWCDATLGHYAEQLWVRGVARRSTLCVLSGLRVRRGDIVYRPCTRGQRSVNCEEVLLAFMVDGVPGGIS